MKQKSSRYMDRAMRSRDPRYARALGRLGYRPTTDELSPDDEVIRRAVSAGIYNIDHGGGRHTHIDIWPVKPGEESATAVPAMTTRDTEQQWIGEGGPKGPLTNLSPREPVEEPAAVEKPAPKPAVDEKPAKKPRAKPSEKLDHDDSGKAGGSRKKTAKGGRYKTRAMKAED